eukprot:6046243-Pyramimonas_sp.AAC.2
MPMPITICRRSLRGGRSAAPSAPSKRSAACVRGFRRGNLLRRKQIIEGGGGLVSGGSDGAVDAIQLLLDVIRAANPPQDDGCVLRLMLPEQPTRRL